MTTLTTTTNNQLLYSGTSPGSVDLILDMNISSRIYQATVTGSGIVTATLSIWVTLDPGLGWIKQADFTLSGTNTASSAFITADRWPNVRIALNTISGTGAVAAVNALLK